jgi:hypothetical protein
MARRLSPNDSRSIVKNPNNRAFDLNNGNRGAQMQQQPLAPAPHGKSGGEVAPKDGPKLG